MISVFAQIDVAHVLHKVSCPSKCRIFKMIAPLLNRIFPRGGVLTAMKCQNTQSLFVLV